MDNHNFFCDLRGQRVNLMACPACKLHPCSRLNAADLSLLSGSPFLSRRVESLDPGKTRMFVIKYQDGSLKEVADLNPNDPDPELMEGVETVYQISREWIPRWVLRPKSKEERQRIIQGELPESEGEDSDPIQVSFI